MSRQPTEPERTLEAITRRLADVHTCAPGIVRAYDSSTGRATVEIAAYPQGEAPPTPLQDVPVRFPAWGGFRMVGPVNPGDECTLHFYSDDPSRHETTGEPGEAQLVRRHGLYAVAVMGDTSDPRRVPTDDDYLHIGVTDGTEIAIKPNEILLGDLGATEPAVLGDALITWLNTHTHATGTGLSGPPTTPADDTQLSSVVKVQS